MPIEIKMPALSPTMEEGNLVSWQKKEGDDVEPGDILAEIETDKAVMEVEAIDEGKLGKILVPGGTEAVKVNQVIAYLLIEGEEEAELEATETVNSLASNGAEKERSEAEQAKANSSPPPPNQDAPQESQQIDQTSSISNPPAMSGKTRPGLASPVARKLADEAGLALTTIQGSGPNGRIVKHDVQRAIKAQKAGQSSVAKREKPAPSVETTRSSVNGGADEKNISADISQKKGAAADPSPMVQKTSEPEQLPPGTKLIKLDGMRQTIARRMVQSKQEVPHFRVTCDCIIDDLLNFRKQVNDGAPEGIRISVNDFVIKAAALCLEALPETNVTWHETGILQHENADIAVAVALEGGLITPIIRQAQGKSLKVISQDMKNLAQKARDRKLLPEDYTGGSFSISNLGMFGVSHFDAIINQPHAMILAVGAGIRKAVVTEEGEIRPATVMSVTLACDHRMVDGALAARWLQRFKRMLENPELLVL